MAGRLENSVEDALRLGEEAEKKYRQYRLPEPKWSGRLKYPFSQNGKLYRWVLPWAGLAATAAFAAGVPAVRQAIHHVYTAVVQAISSPAPVPPPIPTPTAVPMPTATPFPTPKPVPPLKPVVKTEISKPIPTTIPETPVSTPINLDVQPHAAYSNLAVIVKRSEQGPLSVQVLDLDGLPIVMLYQGTLEPGSWVFDWNGKLANGQKAQAGYYQIQVISGPVTQKKLFKFSDLR